MRKITQKEDAVSELVGEMLMLTVVLILLAVFSATLSDFLPPPRDPSVTIMMQNGTNISLYHKGGDWIKSTDLQVIVETDENQVYHYRLGDPNSPITVYSSLTIPNDGIFDLGDRVDINKALITGNPRTIKLASSRVVLFSGRFQ
jgi:FlaG/FlaF family flagellin (archaellin)